MTYNPKAQQQANRAAKGMLNRSRGGRPAHPAGGGNGHHPARVLTDPAPLAAALGPVPEGTLLLVHGTELPGAQPVRTELALTPPPEAPFALVANIPSGQGGRVLDWCARATALTAAVLPAEPAFAARRTGADGRWDLHTVLSWPVLTVEDAGRLPAGSFDPAPEGEVAVLRAVRRPEPLLTGDRLAGYGQFVRTGTSGGLAKRHGREAVAAAFTAAGLDPKAKGATVHPDTWLALFDALVPTTA